MGIPELDYAIVQHLSIMDKARLASICRYLRTLLSTDSELTAKRELHSWYQNVTILWDEYWYTPGWDITTDKWEQNTIIQKDDGPIHTLDGSGYFFSNICNSSYVMNRHDLPLYFSWTSIDPQWYETKDLHSAQKLVAQVARRHGEHRTYHAQFRSGSCSVNHRQFLQWMEDNVNPLPGILTGLITKHAFECYIDIPRPEMPTTTFCINDANSNPQAEIITYSNPMITRCHLIIRNDSPEIRQKIHAFVDKLRIPLTPLQWIKYGICKFHPPNLPDYGHNGKNLQIA